MPGFDTPEPISATLEFEVGSARIIASKRTDTVVEVSPTDNTEGADVRAAELTKVTCSDGRLLVKGPKKRSLFGRSGSIDVRVELPAGSDVQGTSPLADYTCTGLLGDCRLKTSIGDVRVAEARTVYLKTDHGDIHLERATGDTEVFGAGRIEVGRIAGAVTTKNVNGETTIGEVTGDLRAKSSNGRISIGVAHAGVDAKSAHGGIRVGEVARGRIVLQTAAGDLEVGIRESTSAWLEVNTRLGSVRNALESSESPGAAKEKVEVRARTAVGDIVIRRA
ncbi:DUF4097 family beta strand repeat-containing protein [Embleya sp. NBC_00896]|uniref:DUF4097 family beta strand repeat-containing protein n=1 Tax=Embleya sp. NBC_00896 TaxID=2975961 RepID=UPI002F914EF0|nr:DUF4097 family beta strand repeat-containing protein [Embleya sp. NBC_00896]